VSTAEKRDYEGVFQLRQVSFISLIRHFRDWRLNRDHPQKPLHNTASPLADRSLQTSPIDYQTRRFLLPIRRSAKPSTLAHFAEFSNRLRA